MGEQAGHSHRCGEARGLRSSTRFSKPLMVLALVAAVGCLLMRSSWVVASGSPYSQATKGATTNLLIQHPQPVRETRILEAGGVRQVIIIGGGVAGMTAAMYCTRAGLDAVTLTDGNSELSMSGLVENYPGIAPAQGISIMDQISRQATGMGAVVVPARVTSVDTETIPYTVRTQGGVAYQAWSLIVASGATQLWPGFRHELRYASKYIHTCHLCDGFLYAGKEVVVIGGGDSAVESATYLAKVCKKVTLIHRRDRFRAGPSVLAELPKNVVILTPYVGVSWEGGPNGELAGLKVRRVDTFAQGGGSDLSSNVGNEPLHAHLSMGAPKEAFIKADGAFIAIGSKPQTGYLRPDQVKLSKSAHVMTMAGNNVQTSVDGVFAAGEVSDNRYRQAVTASGSGAMAAIEAQRWLTANGHGGLRKKVKDKMLKGTRRQEGGPSPKQGPSQKKKECEMVTKACIKKYVEKHSVVIFSKSYCPYCTTAKELIAKLKVVDVAIVELDQSEHGKEVQDVLQKLTGRRTVPNIFVRGKNIGGLDELKKELPLIELILKTHDNGDLAAKNASSS